MQIANSLSGLEPIQHGFFTRRSGQSTGLYASLNCALGSRDEPATVLRNRDYCAECLSVQPDHLLTLRQEHTADVEVVATPWPYQDSPVADAMITDRPGIALGVLAADCAPVLFADPVNRIIGATHAGWKGAFTGIVAATVRAMQTLGAESKHMHAAIGPCIGFDSYEVGPEFKDRIVKNEPGHTCYFKQSETKDHFYFDLQSFVADRVLETGITKIERIEADTCADEATFFSYRRSCHRDEPDYGRQLSAIALVP